MYRNLADISLCKEREHTKAANPEASIGEIGKLMGARWNGMSDEEKRPFQEKAAAAKVDYTNAMAAYKSGLNQGNTEEPVTKKLKGPENEESTAVKMEDEDDDDDDDDDDDGVQEDDGDDDE